MPKGADVLNVIRNNASAVYQERIPEATAENLHEVGDAILKSISPFKKFISSICILADRIILSTLARSQLLILFKLFL